jgi:nitroimidazol reductase NimA-like FMN-containing flavoprotein (pyridoxamine 5'-phosphate oxidase superfamily)
MEHDGNGLETLDRRECLALLGSVPLGRVVFTERALPAVEPVNFALVEDCVIIRTAPRSKLATAMPGAVVAFEADDFDGSGGAGWSVTVVGKAHAVRDPAEVTRLSRLPLRPWTPGQRDQFIRIPSQHVTGRRISCVPTGNGGQAA